MDKTPVLEFIEFDPSKWRSSRAISSLDAEQKGWLIDLLFISWQSEEQGTLPNDEVLLRDLVKATQGKRWNFVLSFFKERDGVLYNQRLVDEVQRRSQIPKVKVKAEQLLLDEVPQRTGTRGTRIIPKNIVIDEEMIVFGKTKFPDLSRAELVLKLEEIKDEFVDHWLGESRQHAVKLNWNATLRNRIRQVARLENERRTLFESKYANQHSISEELKEINQRDLDALKTFRQPLDLITDVEQ